jgi:hypothetical protein
VTIALRTVGLRTPLLRNPLLCDLLVLQGTWLGISAPRPPRRRGGGGIVWDWRKFLEQSQQKAKAKRKRLIVVGASSSTIAGPRGEASGRVIDMNEVRRKAANAALLDLASVVPAPKAFRPSWLKGAGFISRPDGGFARARLIHVKRTLARGVDGVHAHGENEAEIELLFWPVMDLGEELDQDGWDAISARRVPSKIRQALRWPEEIEAEEKGKGK